MAKYTLQTPKLFADFNGYFGDILCLSHGETCKDESGNEVELSEGMIATAFDIDEDEHNQRDDLIATGVVERSPESLACRGSVWYLRIDDNGLRHESEIPSHSRR